MTDNKHESAKPTSGEANSLLYLPHDDGKPIVSGGKAIAYLDTQDHASFITDDQLQAYLTKCDSMGRQFVAGPNLLEAMSHLLSVTELNLDDLETSTVKAIALARAAIAEATDASIGRVA